MNEIAFRVASHEARHAAAFACLGWPLEEVTRETGLCGRTQFSHRPDKAPLVRALELGIALLAPTLHDSLGNEKDLAEITNLLAESSGRLKMTDIWDATARLVADPDFVVRQRAVEGALMTSLRLSADEVRELVAVKR